MKQIILVSLLIFSTLLLRAQTVENFKLPRDYMGSLDEILPNLGKDLNIRFVYDPAYLKKYRTSLMTNNERTVGGVLKMFSKAWDMVTLIGKDGFIYIARDRESLNQLLQLKDEEKVVRSVSRRTLIPVKRNFLLSGEIRDVASGETIPFATVRIEGTTKGVLSDQNGHFALQNVPADTAVLVISYLGYHTNMVELEPQKENPPLNIDIKQQSVGISEVFIYGRKDDKALQKSVLEQNIKMSPVALNVLPNVGEKDFMRGFQLMPGVSAANEGSAGMAVSN